MIDALMPFRVASPTQNPPVLDYLKTEGLRNFDINLEVYIHPKDGKNAWLALLGFESKTFYD